VIDMDSRLVVWNDIVNRVKEEIDIPKNWYATEVNEEIFQTLSELKGVEKNLGKVTLKTKDGVFTSFKDSFCTNGALKSKDFIYITTNIYGIGDLDYGKTVNIIFTKAPFEAFFKKYLKNSEDVQHVNIDNGIYDVINTMIGRKLNLIKVDKTDQPILSDNLNEKIISEIQNFSKAEELYTTHNLEYKRGMLLYGNPGNGKTSLLKTYLSDLDAITVFVKASDYDELAFIEKFLNSPSLDNRLKIIVFEDIDGVRDMCRSKFLNLVDGVSKVYRTVFVATTNYPHTLDKAIINRPSRFDSLYNVAEPTKDSRYRILKRLAPESNEEDLNKAVEITKGLSGAFVKEVFVYSFINKISLAESAKQIKERLKILSEFGGSNYVS
jgi:hypothetical protein